MLSLAPKHKESPSWNITAVKMQHTHLRKILVITKALAHLLLSSSENSEHRIQRFREDAPIYCFQHLMSLWDWVPMSDSLSGTALPCCLLPWILTPN